MQAASFNYADAATGAGGVWADPRLRADWMRDGYDTTAVMLDPFERNLTDQWGAAPPGQSWINSAGPASAFDVVYDGGTAETSGYATHTVLEADDGSFKTRNSVLSGPLEFVADHLVAVQMPVPTGAQVESLTLLRYIDGNNHYRVGVIIFPGGTVSLAAVRAVGGVETGLFGVTSAITYTNLAVLWYRAQIRADGTVRVKAWLDGTTEPGEWGASSIDVAQIGDSGVPGLHTTSYPGNTNTRPLIVRYPMFQVTNLLPDDLSNQAGAASVTHFMDDGLPDSVAFISGVGTPELTVNLGAPPSYLTQDEPLTVAEYYSPFNPDSPIYGQDRDVAPVDYALGVVGAAGPERITVFTGQMADIPVKRGVAQLAAVSATRMKLAKLVQPPAVNGVYQGANATWPISYALAACGVYASPPPQTGCRWWTPMHGSIRPFLPATNAEVTDTFVTVDTLIGPSRRHPIRTCDGPFVAAVENGVNPGFSQRSILATTVDTIQLEPGPDLVSQTSVGKFESWVRGDDVNLNSYPAGSGFITSLYRMIITNVNGSAADVLIRTDRKLQATMTDGTNTASITSTNPLPTDGAWHFVGFAWDVANKKVWLNLDGTVQSSTNGSIVVANFPTTDNFAVDRPNPLFTLPCAELQLTAGVTGSVVSPDVGPWLFTIPFTRQAVVNRSVMDLVNIAEPNPQEAWAYIAGFAQAELASMRTDELDVFNYLTSGWWVKAAQQVIADTYSTEINTGNVDLNIDSTKIRNEVLVSFGEVLSPNQFQTVFSNSEAVPIPPGFTILVLPLSKSAFELRGFTFVNIAAADTVQPTNVNSISFNGATDGTGAYYSQAYAIATVLSWNPGEAIVQIHNLSTITMYLANNKNWPSITLAAKAQDETSTTIAESDATSIATRGERSLPVTANVLQTRVNARRLARRLLMALRKPLPTAEEIPLFGEARRQPGDLVTFEDPSMTRVSGLWRTQSVSHELTVQEDQIEYTNRVIVRPTLPICVVGQGIVGASLIGPTQ